MLSRLPPPRLDRSHIDPSPRMLGNDQIGDCTSAGLGNAIRAIAALGRYQINVTDEDAELFYEETTGYVPGDATTDKGAVEVDVLSYAMQHGYPTQGGAFYPMWGSVDVSDRASVANVMAALGPVYLGVMLSASDMSQIATEGMSTTLHPDNHAYGDTTPGSAGGHCLLGWDYTGMSDADTVTLITWGCATIKATWGWLSSRGMEAHGLLFSQLALPSGLYPTGQALDEVKSANRSFLMG